MNETLINQIRSIQDTFNKKILRGVSGEYAHANYFKYCLSSLEQGERNGKPQDVLLQKSLTNALRKILSSYFTATSTSVPLTALQEKLAHLISEQISDLNKENFLERLPQCQEILRQALTAFPCFPQEWVSISQSFATGQSNLAGYPGRHLPQFSLIAAQGPQKDFNRTAITDFSKLLLTKRPVGVLAALTNCQDSEDIAPYWMHSGLGSYSSENSDGTVSHFDYQYLGPVLSSKDSQTPIAARYKLTETITDASNQTIKASSHEFSFGHISVRDNRPLRLDSFGRELLLKFFEDSYDSDHELIIHCFAGLGRTGMISYLKALLTEFEKDEGSKALIRRLLDEKSTPEDLTHVADKMSALLNTIRQERFTIQSEEQLQCILPQLLLLWAQKNGHSQAKLESLEDAFAAYQSTDYTRACTRIDDKWKTLKYPRVTPFDSSALDDDDCGSNDQDLLSEEVQSPVVSVSAEALDQLDTHHNTASNSNACSCACLDWLSSLFSKRKIARVWPLLQEEQSGEAANKYRITT